MGWPLQREVEGRTLYRESHLPLDQDFPSQSHSGTDIPPVLAKARITLLPLTKPQASLLVEKREAKNDPHKVCVLGSDLYV